MSLKLPEDAKSFPQRLLDVFLPAGYPHSVTEDYLQYEPFRALLLATTNNA